MPKYFVTEKAGPWVAGTRNNGVGSEMELTKEQAAHEVRLGTLVEAEPTKAAKKETAAASTDEEKAPAKTTRKKKG